MSSLADPRTSNPVLSTLQITVEDRIISIKENGNADSNFILTHIMKQILYENNKLCLVSFHNSTDHYQVVGKKLGYDLFKRLEDKEIRLIEPINDIVDSIEFEGHYFQEDKENIVKCLYFDIKTNLEHLLSDGDKQVYLIIDDLSHLMDLCVDISLVINFVNYCIGLVKNDRINMVLNSHVSSTLDEIISNNLQYLADVHIEVFSLKTGRSNDVTGYFTIDRSSGNKQYQFKTFDRGIKTFHPGESIYHLFK